MGPACHLAPPNLGMTTVILRCALKTAVSIPDPVFHQADQAAKRLGLSRSELYARAVSRFLHDQRNEGVTEALDRIYEHESADVDSALAAMQAASLSHDDW